MTNTYRIEAATEYGVGNGVNGTGRRPKISGFYVLTPEGRRVVAFTGPKAQEKAAAHAARCNENLLPQYYA